MDTVQQKWDSELAPYKKKIEALEAENEDLRKKAENVTPLQPSFDAERGEWEQTLKEKDKEILSLNKVIGQLQERVDAANNTSADITPEKKAASEKKK